jgi:hypothetical protein
MTDLDVDPRSPCECQSIPPPSTLIREPASDHSSPAGKQNHHAVFLGLVLLFSAVLGCIHVHLVLEAAATITVTFDETAHVGAGVTFWKYKDFRLNPENGVLPQLIAGAGIILGRPGTTYTIPTFKQQAWRYSDCWSIGFQLLHESGNNLPDILHDGRRGIAVRVVCARCWSASSPAILHRHVAASSFLLLA